MPRGRKKQKISTPKKQPSNPNPTLTNIIDGYEPSENLINITMDDNKLIVKERKSRRAAKAPSPPKSKTKLPKRRTMKLDSDIEDNLDSELEFEDFEEDYMGSEDEDDFYMEKSQKTGGKANANQEEFEEEDSLGDDEESFQNPPSSNIINLQSTTYLSKRLTKRQKAVQVKSDLDNDEDGIDQALLDEIYETNKHDKKKKKKNILTAEEKQKKIEMEEKRRAHQQRVSEEQKQHIVNKILNENKDKKKEKITEYERRAQLRIERLSNRKFNYGDIVVKHRSNNTTTSVILPRNLSFQQLITQDFRNFNPGLGSPLRRAQTHQYNYFNSGLKDNLLVIRRKSSGTRCDSPNRKRSLQKESSDDKGMINLMSYGYSDVCSVSGCGGVRKYKLKLTGDVQYLGACGQDCYKKLKVAS